jgi:hypothetical protein
MAQIIKHRRGGITQLKDVTARIGEVVMATGSISDLNGPFLFVGESEGVAGAYRPASKIYQGTTAPTLTAGSHGSVLDGTPFYAAGNKSFYILSQAGNSRINLTGNIEGNTISGVTINNLTGSIGTFDTYVSASAVNVTGNTQIGGTLTVQGATSINDDLYITGNTYQTGSIYLTGDVVLSGSINIGDNISTDIINFQGEVSSSIIPKLNNTFDLGSPTNAWQDLYVSGTAHIENISIGGISTTNLYLPGDLVVSGTTILSGSVHIENTLNVSSSAAITGGLYVGGDFTANGSNSTLTANYGGNSISLNTYNGATINLSGPTNINGDTSVTGALNVGGNTNFSGSVYVEDLTQKRLVVVGADGLLTDYSGLTFDNGNLNVSGAIEVTNIQGTGSLYLKPDQADGRYFEIYNTGASDTHIKSSGGLSFFGDDTNYLKVDDYSQTATLVGVNGVIVSSSLQVTGSVFTDKILGTGSLYLQPDQIDGRYFEIYNTGASDVHIKSSNGLSFFGDDTNYLMINDSAQTVTIVGVNGVNISSSLTVTGATTIHGDETVNGILTVTGNTQLGGNLYISGTLEVLGSATEVHIQSQVVELDDNIIRLNAYSPFERYAGFEVMDSGSSGISASMLWDSLNDYWMFVSASGQTSKFVGTTAGAYGSEVSLTTNSIVKATGASTIGDSLLVDNGTTLSYNTNKFIITGSTGETLIYGNVTLSAVGGTDAGTKTSAIMFRNSSNVLGYVSTTTGTVETNALLGYKQSDGTLVFSDLIDGGSY